MKYFLAMNLSEQLGKITVPVMALNGTLDTQVDCERNLEALRKGLPSHEKNVIRAEEGLNHLFQHCKTGEFSEYKTIEETFSPEVLAEMSAWLQKLFWNSGQ